MEQGQNGRGMPWQELYCPMQHRDERALCAWRAAHPEDGADQKDRGVWSGEHARSVAVRGWCDGVCACRMGNRSSCLAAAESDAVKPAMGTFAMACHLCAACQRTAMRLLAACIRTSATSCRPTPATQAIINHSLMEMLCLMKSTTFVKVGCSLTRHSLAAAASMCKLQSQ